MSIWALHLLETDVCAISLKPDGRDLRPFPVWCVRLRQKIHSCLFAWDLLPQNTPSHHNPASSIGFAVHSLCLL